MADAHELLGQPVIVNGIALSKIHHAAFNHLIGIDPGRPSPCLRAVAEAPRRAAALAEPQGDRGCVDPAAEVSAASPGPGPACRQVRAVHACGIDGHRAGRVRGGPDVKNPQNLGTSSGADQAGAPRSRSQLRPYSGFESRSPRQNAQSGHSLRGRWWHSERRRMRAFLASRLNHVASPRGPFQAVFGLSPAAFSGATEPRPFWLSCTK